MKKVICALILPLVVLSGLVFANRVIKNDAAHQPLAAAVKNAHRDDKKKWEASPDGLRYKKWEASPDGKKARASADKIRDHISAFTNMDAIITSISCPSGSSGGFGLKVKIDGEEYLVNYWPEPLNQNFMLFSNDLQQLYDLKVNDKIVIRSRSAGYLGKGKYLVLSGDYLERNGKMVYHRDLRKGGC